MKRNSRFQLIFYFVIFSLILITSFSCGQRGGEEDQASSQGDRRTPRAVSPDQSVLGDAAVIEKNLFQIIAERNFSTAEDAENLAAEMDVKNTILARNKKLTPEQVSKWLAYFIAGDPVQALGEMKAGQLSAAVVKITGESREIADSSSSSTLKLRTSWYNNIVKLTGTNFVTNARAVDTFKALGVLDVEMTSFEDFKKYAEQINPMAEAVVGMGSAELSNLSLIPPDISDSDNFGTVAMGGDLPMKQVAFDFVVSNLIKVDGKAYLKMVSFDQARPTVSLVPFPSNANQEVLFQPVKMSEAYLEQIQKKVDALRAEAANNPEVAHRYSMELAKQVNARRLLPKLTVRPRTEEDQQRLEDILRQRTPPRVLVPPNP